MVARKTVCLRRPGGSRGGEPRAGRFFANPKVTAAKIVEGWSPRTGVAVAGRHVLAIQDTTEVKFPTTVRRRRGLGPVKKGNTCGVVAHAMIAVDAESHACQGHARSNFRRGSRIEPYAPLQWRCGSARSKSAAPRDERDRGPPKTVRLCLIEAREIHPPDGVEPLHWRLLTTHDVADAEKAWQIIGWYQARRTIEQLFRVTKSQGPRLEDSQLASADRLVRLAAAAIKAARIDIQLVQERGGRHQWPATTVFVETEIDTLETLNPTLEGNTERQQNPHPARSLARAGWGHRPPRWLELLLQTPGTNNFQPGNGAVPRNSPWTASWIETGTRCETPLVPRRRPFRERDRRHHGQR